MMHFIRFAAFFSVFVWSTPVVGHAFAIKGSKEPGMVVTWGIEYVAQNKSAYCRSIYLEPLSGVSNSLSRPKYKNKIGVLQRVFGEDTTNYEIEVIDRSQEYCQYKFRYATFEVTNPARGITSNLGFNVSYHFRPDANGLVDMNCEARRFSTTYSCHSRFSPWTGNRIIENYTVNFRTVDHYDVFFVDVPFERVELDNTTNYKIREYVKSYIDQPGSFAVSALLNSERVGVRSVGTIRCNSENCRIFFGGKEFALEENQVSYGYTQHNQEVINSMRKLRPGSGTSELEADLYFDDWIGRDYSWITNVRAL